MKGSARLLDRIGEEDLKRWVQTKGETEIAWKIEKMNSKKSLRESAENKSFFVVVQSRIPLFLPVFLRPNSIFMVGSNRRMSRTPSMPSPGLTA